MFDRPDDKEKQGGCGNPDSRVVVIAASAGGIRPLVSILEALPPDFPAPILAVQHLCPTFASKLNEVLGDRTGLPVLFANDNVPCLAGRVYLAPPNYHLTINRHQKLVLRRDGKVCFTRPAADPLFLSAALAFQNNAVAVVLSGQGYDASMGVRAIAGTGGITIAQAPATCDFPDMPQNAIDTGCIDYVLNPGHIASALISLVMVKGAATWLHVAPQLLEA